MIKKRFYIVIAQHIHILSDLFQLPLFAKAKPIEVVVNPGDMVFVFTFITTLAIIIIST